MGGFRIQKYIILNFYLAAPYYGKEGSTFSKPVSFCARTMQKLNPSIHVLNTFCTVRF